MRELCSFLGVAYHDQLVAHIDGGRASNRPALDIDPLVREGCSELQSRLDALTASRDGAGSVGGLA